MFKLLFLLVIFVVIFVFKIILAGIGTVSVLVNKRGAFENFARQFLKHTEQAQWVLKPCLAQLIDKVLNYSNIRNYKITDTLDVLEATLRHCVIKINEKDLCNLPQQTHYLPEADGFILATEFLNENNIK